MDVIPLICGMDEAGRGPMAGPVCAAAVILPPDFNLTLLDDSKKLTEKKRNEAAREIYRNSLFWGLAWASASEIDSINILRASLLAMSRAWNDLREKAERVMPGFRENVRIIVDGLYCPDLGDLECEAHPKADATFPSVMAASILAKTARDRLMCRYGWLYPEYGYEQHKGYPTQSHRNALKKYGPSPIQRTTFRLKDEGQLPLF